MVARSRSRIRLVLKDGTRIVGESSWPTFIVRYLVRRCTMGKSPALFATSGDARVVVEPGAVADFLVAAYEGPPRRTGQ